MIALTSAVLAAGIMDQLLHVNLAAHTAPRSALPAHCTAPRFPVTGFSALVHICPGLHTCPRNLGGLASPHTCGRPGPSRKLQCGQLGGEHDRLTATIEKERVEVRPVPVQMWEVLAQSRRRCGRGEPNTIGFR